MATTADLVRYLRACYEADNRETGIVDLWQRKIRHTHFLCGTEDLLRGILPRVPVALDHAETARKEAQLYRRDKTLVYAALPIVGRGPAGTRLPTKLCAPLVFYPAALSEAGGVAHLEIDADGGRANFPVLKALAGQSESADAVIEALLAELPEPPWQQSDIHRLAGVLAELLPQIDTLPLASYPRLTPADEVRRAMNAGDTDRPLQCLPACAMALVPNSPETRGVLFELAQIADAGRFSQPLRSVLGHEHEPPGMQSMQPGRTRHPAVVRVPTVLSEPQRRVLDSAGVNPLTLVIGPPGTGKSYTIAALALSHVARGESVLVASRMNQAVDVVARKIEQMIGPSHAVVRAGRKEYLRDLKRRLDLILQGALPGGDAPDDSARALSKRFGRLSRRIAATERRIEREVGWHVDWGRDAVEDLSAGFWDRIATFCRSRYAEFRLRGAAPLGDRLRAYEEALTERNRLCVRLIHATLHERLGSLLADRRKDLSKFVQGIRSRSDAKQQRLFDEIDLSVLFGAFPVWLAKLADLSDVLPAYPEMFDLAVLDEASQCDLASSLPLLQRAKRVVIVGDPHQLRHVSFLSRRRQQSLGEQHGLSGMQPTRFDFRDRSVLDVVADSITTQDRVLFLDEHYRSLPQIIAFSNREFYGGTLHLMRQRPETARLRCVEPRFVPGGNKSAGGPNPREAEALVDDLVRLVESEASLPAGQCCSIGVLSPFRDQVDHVSALLEERLPLSAMERHDLLVGTAHSFQGEERDVMFLSLAVDPHAHAATLNFLNDPHVFNVSITRARQRQYVYCSLEPEDLGRDSLLQRFLGEITEPLPEPTHTPGPADAFRSEVHDELRARSFTVWDDYPVAGWRIDLVAQRGGVAVGIDLIGYPGQLTSAFPLDRYRMFRRAGLPLVPLTYRAWRSARDECLRAVERRCGAADGF